MKEFIKKIGMYLKIFINKYLLIFQINTSDTLPDKADSVFFNVAPVINIGVALLVFLIIPFDEKALFIGVEAGVLLVFAILCLDVFGCLMAGIGSNTKNAIIGGLRAARQVINARLVALVTIIPIILSSGSLRFVEIVDAQRDKWFIFPHLMMFICFLFAMLAFMMIKPFNLTDSSSEISGGYRKEYSGVSLLLFEIGDLLSMLAVAAFAVIMFLGGWLAPKHLFFEQIPSLIWFFIKLFACLAVMFFIKNKAPRFREDQMRSLLWKFIFPTSIFWSFLTAGFLI